MSTGRKLVPSLLWENLLVRGEGGRASKRDGPFNSEHSSGNISVVCIKAESGSSAWIDTKKQLPMHSEMRYSPRHASYITWALWRQVSHEVTLDKWKGKSEHVTYILITMQVEDCWFHKWNVVTGLIAWSIKCPTKVVKCLVLSDQQNKSIKSSHLIILSIWSDTFRLFESKTKQWHK